MALIVLIVIVGIAIVLVSRPLSERLLAAQSSNRPPSSVAHGFVVFIGLFFIGAGMFALLTR